MEVGWVGYTLLSVTRDSISRRIPLVVYALFQSYISIHSNISIANLKFKVRRKYACAL